jgi:hypothetical protein
MACSSVMTVKWQGPKALGELFRDVGVVKAGGGLTLGGHGVIADEQGRAVEEFMNYAETAFEEVSATTWARKQFVADAPLRSARICIAGFPLRGSGKVEGTFNGKPFSVRGKCDKQWYSDWLIIPVPAPVKRGRNQLVIRTTGSLVWRLFIEPSLLPDRSARSTDGGRSWDSSHLGLGRFLDGEYVIRLSGQRTAAKGTVTSPALQVRADGCQVAAAGRVTSLGVKISAKLPVEVRIGNGPWAERSEHWSSWRSPSAAGLRAMERELGEPGPRFVQWRATLSMRTGRSKVLKSVELKVKLKRSADCSRLAVKVDAPVTVLPGRPFAHQRPNPRLEAVRRQYKLDRVWARGANDWESMLWLSAWVGNYCSYRHSGPFGKGTRYDLVEILEFGHAKTCKVLCGQLAFAFVQLACAYGQTARVVCRGNHLVSEVWSPLHRKWAMVDSMDQVLNAKTGKWIWTAGFGGYYHDGDGVPLSATEIGESRKKLRRKHLVWKTKKYASRAAEAARDLHWFRKELSWPERNNHTDCWEPVFWGDVFRYSGYLKYRRGTEGVMPWYSEFTSRRADVEWTVGEVAAFVTVVDADRLLVQMDSRMPNTVGFRIGKLPAAAATDSDLWPADSYLWAPQRSAEKLELRAVNAFGIEGPATRCQAVLE